MTHISQFRCIFPDAREIYLESAFRDLINRYSEPHRRYHTLSHIEALFDELGKTGYGAGVNGDVVDIAILSHDVFYDTQAVNNEWRSSIWCINVCRLLGRPELCEPAAECIRATRHDRYPESAEARLVCDVDLSILGADTETFDLYERQIREEYSWVPEDRFRAGRTSILKEGLLSGPIYRRGDFRKRYEKAARQNLERSLAALAPS